MGRIISGRIKNPYQFTGQKKIPGRDFYFLAPFCISIFYGTAPYPSAMDKPSILIEPVDSAHNRPFDAAGAGSRSRWSDAETRAFLERPGYSPLLTKILRVILITAMVVAGVKVAWILAFHA
jgi:hypothetical protein